MANVVLGENLVMPKTSGFGVKVDQVTPTFGFNDIIGFVRPDITGVNAPTLAAWRGGSIREFFFNTNDKFDISYHFQHDLAPSTDIFLHVHWGHNGTAISGQLVLTCALTYAKGHNQTIFPAEITTTITVPTPDIVTIPRWVHRIDEIQISSSTPDSTHLDRALLEPDGILLCSMTATTIPTITGSASLNRPAIFTLDLHYQTTSLGTKNKTPNFYT